MYYCVLSIFNKKNSLTFYFVNSTSFRDTLYKSEAIPLVPLVTKDQFPFFGDTLYLMKLLTGPTSDDPSDPFVLVGAAHCNYVCKDSNTGNTLETCCCRPDSVLSSCLNKSPYCVGKPEFKLAEPKVCLPHPYQNLNFTLWEGSRDCVWTV